MTLLSLVSRVTFHTRKSGGAQRSRRAVLTRSTRETLLTNSAGDSSQTLSTSLSRRSLRSNRSGFPDGALCSGFTLGTFFSLSALLACCSDGSPFAGRSGYSSFARWTWRARLSGLSVVSFVAA